jgi:homoserine kinase
MSNGALGCSISGAGPTVFAWCEQQDAERIRDAMVAGFTSTGMACDAWISTLESSGARIVD